MEIRNLGPITDANINFNQLMLFIGNNGTGKTLAAYSLYAFRNWLEYSFQADVVKSDELDQLVGVGKLGLPYDELESAIAIQIVTAFNKLNVSGRYFVDFFKDHGVYVPGKSSITISDDDVKGLAKKSGVAFSYFAEDSQGSVSQYQVHMDGRKTPELEIFNTMSQKKVDGPQRLISREELLSRINRALVGSLFDSSATSRYLPAERIGINVFRTRLNTRLVDESLTNPASMATSRTVERYPYPIESYISFLNNSVLALSQPDSSDLTEESKKLMAALVPGSFSYDEALDSIQYRLSDEADNSDAINFNLLSSSLKSLFGLELFVHQYAQRNWLFIDEPEMNLHPTRQVMVMDLLLALAEADNHVVISTHSDYLVKELLNKILESKLGDKQNHVGIRSRVSVYEFKDGSVRDLGDISEEEDFDDPDQTFENFDQTTVAINDRYDDLRNQMDDEGTDNE